MVGQPVIRLRERFPHLVVGLILMGVAIVLDVPSKQSANRILAATISMPPSEINPDLAVELQQLQQARCSLPLLRNPLPLVAPEIP